MRHPSNGTLRRLLDEPAGVADADREHVAACPTCLSELTAAQRDAALARQALTDPGRPVHADPGADLSAELDVDAAWARLSAATAAGARPHGPATAPRRRPSWRGVLRSPAVAALGVAAVLAGGGVAAAADWLPIFRTERVAPVTLTEADLVALPDLSAYGDLEVTAEPGVRQVAGAAAAREATGLPVPQVADLPRGVTGDPTFRVGGRAQLEFTFSAAKAAATAAEAGGTAPPAPAGLDGSRFRLSAGPGLAALWTDGRGLPAMVVARAVAPAVSSSGVPFATARDHLLSLPGLPANLASQLRAISGDGTTLPLPVPSGRFTSSATDVGGAPGTLLTSRDGTIAIVVWVRDGVVTAVGGSLSDDEVLSVARGLR